MRVVPRKKDFRMRAHINPLGIPFFPFPPHPSYVDWKQHFPLYFNGTLQENHSLHCNTARYPISYHTQHALPHKNIDFLDIGCGYGGLLFALAPHFPSKLIFGLEIRDKLVDYVGEKIRGYRMLHPQRYDNISVVRANCMRHLCHYIPKATVEKIFICFPDPHFKPKNAKRRIVSTGALSEYAYLMKPGGRLYCITDVEELHSWHLKHLRTHSLFREVEDCSDPCIHHMISSTEEGHKVDRKQREKLWAIFERTEDDAA